MDWGLRPQSPGFYREDVGVLRGKGSYSGVIEQLLRVQFST